MHKKSQLISSLVILTLTQQDPVCRSMEIIPIILTQRFKVVSCTNFQKIYVDWNSFNSLFVVCRHNVKTVGAKIKQWIALFFWNVTLKQYSKWVCHSLMPKYDIGIDFVAEYLKFNTVVKQYV